MRTGSSFLIVALLFAAVLGRGPVAIAQNFDDDEAASEVTRSKLFEALAVEIEALERQSNVLKKVVRLVRPTVVHIEAEKIDLPTGRSTGRGRVEEAGSGFIVRLRENYYVVTNRHVIRSAALRDIKIRLADGRQLGPSKAWTDPDTDVAVMAVSAQRLVASRIGNSDATEIGDFVLAVGSPFGLSHSVTFGIVSAKGRRDLELLSEGVRFQDFIQTDAAINPGNSGGPLINLRGEVIGMNTAIASSSGGNEGIGFTIPANMVMIVARQLVERGVVERAFLGVALDSKFGPASATSVGLQRPQGTRVTRITPGSPADTAKLLPGDVILEYGGVHVEDDAHLINMVSLTEVGKEVPLVVFRDRKVITLLVKVGSAAALKATSGE